MKKTIGITLLVTASFIGSLAAAAYALRPKRRTGSSFRDLYKDNAPKREGGWG